jgi:hypothetical protein
MERVTVLLSTLPMRTTDQLGIKATLTAYSEALEGCDIRDLRSVVAAMFAGPRKWAPSAPDLGQAVRDAAARRENTAQALEYAPEPDRDPPTAEEYARMMEKWANIRGSFDVRDSPEEFLRKAKADGRLTEAT